MLRCEAWEVARAPGGKAGARERSDRRRRASQPQGEELSCWEGPCGDPAVGRCPSLAPVEGCGTRHFLAVSF